MKIQRLILVVIIINSFLACQNSKKVKQKDIGILNLQKSPVSDQFDPDFIDVLYPAFQKNSEYQEYEKKRLDKFKNIPQLDSFRIVSKILDKDLYNLDLFKKRLISKEELLDNTKDVHFDSSLMVQDISTYRFNAVFGFKDNKKKIIPDLNNNFNFEDDPKMSFSSDSMYSFEDPKSIKNIAVQNFRYQGLVNNKLKWIERTIKVYPNSNSIYKYMIEEDVKDKVDAIYTVMILFEDNWKVNKKINKIPYHIIVYGGMINKYPTIEFKPDSINHNLFSQDNFIYKLSDTIKVGSNYYVIDSIGTDLNHLYISELLAEKENEFGRRIGDKIKNYELEDLHGQKFNWYTSEKKYRLLDFWGTWCKPCKELTPALKDLYNENSDKLEIISIAADNNREDVQKYVTSNNLNWQHAYIYLKDYSVPIRKELKIFSFPTLVLLDQNNRILIKGHSASFNKIQEYIRSN